jgi:hypothetical protein
MKEGSGSGSRAGSGSIPLTSDPDPGGPKTCGSGSGSGTLPKRKILILKIIFSVYIQTKPKPARMVTIFFRRGNLHQSPEKTSVNPPRLNQLILSTASSRAWSSSVWRTFCRQATDLALILRPMRRRGSRTGTTRRIGASMRYCRRSTRSPIADRSGS